MVVTSEVGTGVSHRVVEPELVEVVTDIIVALHIGFTFLLGVALLWQELTELGIPHEAAGTFVGGFDQFLDATLDFDLVIHVGFPKCN